MEHAEQADVDHLHGRVDVLQRHHARQVPVVVEPQPDFLGLESLQVAGPESRAQVELGLRAYLDVRERLVAHYGGPGHRVHLSVLQVHEEQVVCPHRVIVHGRAPVLARQELPADQAAEHIVGLHGHLTHLHSVEVQQTPVDLLQLRVPLSDPRGGLDSLDHGMPLSPF